jgi:hypothetical protein
MSGWRRQHPELEESIRVAETELQAECIALFENAKNKHGGSDVQANIFLLERRWPAEFGAKSQVDHSHAGEINMSIISPEAARHLQERRQKMSAGYVVEALPAQPLQIDGQQPATNEASQKPTTSKE